MGKAEPVILAMRESLAAAGVGMATSDKGIARDAKALGERFAARRQAIAGRARSPRLFVAVSSDYDEKAGTYRYAMGDVVDSFEGLPEGLERIDVPAGTYAAFAVRPILGFLWGPAIGATYAYAYGKWLPASAWKHARVGIEHFEYHDERSSRRIGAEIEIRIPVEPK